VGETEEIRDVAILFGGFFKQSKLTQLKQQMVLCSFAHIVFGL